MKQLASGQTSLRISTNLYDWLGNGIYFWENNQQRALEFAGELKAKKSKSKINTPAVIGAVIDLGLCLDLMDAEYIALVKDSYTNLVQSCTTLGLEVPVNSQIGNSKDLLLRNLDRAVVQNLHNIREENGERPFDSVRSAFVEGDELYPNAGFHEKNHIQLCIRNPNCIKGYFLPRKEDNDWIMS